MSRYSASWNANSARPTAVVRRTGSCPARIDCVPDRLHADRLFRVVGRVAPAGLAPEQLED